MKSRIDATRLFGENAELARIFIPGWRANHCPWIFSVKMLNWRGFSCLGGRQVALPMELSVKISSASVDFHTGTEGKTLPVELSVKTIRQSGIHHFITSLLGKTGHFMVQ
ncbi:hypothetical protein [Geobacillus sp. YF-1]|uniref:hypothetical protein n=1 Tax=Geobacillus sp. YF-1 TaxID=3457480 RepID=UPI004045F4C8